MKRIVISLLLTATFALVPSGIAGASMHPPLTLSKGHQLIQQYSARSVNATGGGFATVGACGHVTAWKVQCVSSLTTASQSRCVMLVTVWNTAVTGGYYGRRYSYRGLKCVAAAAPVTPVMPIAPVTPTVPVTNPVSIPAELARSVADAYVGGIMRNAQSFTGGVTYCNYPIGYSDSCSYSFSGNRIADGSFYSCSGNLTIAGSYDSIAGWTTSVDYGIGPQCY